VWEQFVFLLNGAIFILIGLQVGGLRTTAFPHGLGGVLWTGVIVSLVAIGVRLVWVPVATLLPRLLSARIRARDPLPPASYVFLVGWTGLRGIVSLAAALALPLTTSTGAPFPFRGEIIVITFVVIGVTLVLGGLSLSPLIRVLRLPADRRLAHEEAHAREHAIGAALARLEEVSGEDWVVSEHLDRLRSSYAERRDRLDRGTSDAVDSEVLRRLHEHALAAERHALLELRDREVISDDVLHRLEHELNLEALRIGLGEFRPPARGRTRSD
jgi:CPA1 family monovalent cation:H+ antiporter